MERVFRGLWPGVARGGIGQPAEYRIWSVDVWQVKIFISLIPSSRGGRGPGRLPITTLPLPATALWTFISIKAVLKYGQVVLPRRCLSCRSRTDLTGYKVPLWRWQGHKGRPEKGVCRTAHWQPISARAMPKVREENAGTGAFKYLACLLKVSLVGGHWDGNACYMWLWWL